MIDSTRLPTANERLKSAFGGTIGGSLIAAVLLHMLAFHFSPVWTTEDWTGTTAAAVPIVRLDQIPIPVAPRPMSRPATPVVTPGAEVETTLDVFDFRTVTELPPPAPAPASTTQGESSAFVVFTVAPVLIDPDGFQRNLLRVYPAALRDAGIGGTVVLLLAIDAEGVPTSATIGTGSGYARLDEAALQLADQMRFRPAMNRDIRVPVTVSIPIEFRVRREASLRTK